MIGFQRLHGAAARVPPDASPVEEDAALDDGTVEGEVRVLEAYGRTMRV
jgi:hypothetical protein